MNQTVSKLTGTQVRELVKDNELIIHQNKKLVDLDNDYRDMLIAKEESRKQLEAKFLDVSRKMKSTREYIESEKRRMEDISLAFQSKFIHQMENMDENFHKQLNIQITHNDDRFQDILKQTQKLNQDIEFERQDRIKWNFDNLKVIRAQIAQLQELFQNEKQDRIRNEKQILQKLSDESFNLTENLDQHRTRRVLETKQLRDRANEEIQKLQKLNATFNNNTLEEFKHIINHLEIEVTNRLQQQDTIVDNLSNFVKTIQDTLHVLGSKAPKED